MRIGPLKCLESVRLPDKEPPPLSGIILSEILYTKECFIV